MNINMTKEYLDFYNNQATLLYKEVNVQIDNIDEFIIKATEEQIKRLGIFLQYKQQYQKQLYVLLGGRLDNVIFLSEFRQK